MLHVTNGDCAADRIARAGFGGEILPWRDVLHEGPVPANLDDAGLRVRRAEFLGGPEPAAVESALRDLEERDARLAVPSRDEIVLWFEPDLYDQLQLLQVLDRLSRDDLTETPVTAVASVERMGDLQVQESREPAPRADCAPPGSAGAGGPCLAALSRSGPVTPGRPRGAAAPRAPAPARSRPAPSGGAPRAPRRALSLGAPGARGAGVRAAARARGVRGRAPRARSVRLPRRPGVLLVSRSTGVGQSPTGLGPPAGLARAYPRGRRRGGRANRRRTQDPRRGAGLDRSRRFGSLAGRG